MPLELLLLLVAIVAMAVELRARKAGRSGGPLPRLMVVGASLVGLIYGWTQIGTCRSHGLDPIEKGCLEAQAAPLLADRERALANGGGSIVCSWLSNELAALKERGECPAIVPRDTPCTCGTLRIAQDAPCDRNECLSDETWPSRNVQGKVGRVLVCSDDGTPTDRFIQEGFRQWEDVTPCWERNAGTPALTCRVHADLDGDGKRDRLVLVESHGNAWRGLAVFFAGKPGGVLLHPELDGWPFKSDVIRDLTAWSPLEKANAPKGLIPGTARGDAVRLEGRGLLLFWDGTRIVAAPDRGQRPPKRPNR